MASRSINARLINACLPEEIHETETVEDRAIAWKRLRPSFIYTACKSLYNGALISFLSAVFIGIFYLLISYLCFKNYSRLCILRKEVNTNSCSVDANNLGCCFSCVLLHVDLCESVISVPSVSAQRHEEDTSLVCFVAYCLDISYRVSLQFLAMPYYLAPTKLIQVPVYIVFLVSISSQLYIVNKNFAMGSTRNLLSRTCKMIVPICLPFIAGIFHMRLPLSILYQTRRQGKSHHCSVLPTHRSLCENDITNLCSAVVEYKSPWVFVCAIGAFAPRLRISLSCFTS